MKEAGSAFQFDRGEGYFASVVEMNNWATLSRRKRYTVSSVCMVGVNAPLFLPPPLFGIPLSFFSSPFYGPILITSVQGEKPF